MYNPLISVVKFFDNKDPDFLWAFLPLLEPMSVFSKDVLYN
jgi:hypothetical protein